MNKIVKFISKDGRKIWTNKTTAGDEKFDKNFWKKISPSVKFSTGWQIIVDAMMLKGTLEKLKFKKIITVTASDQKIIKVIDLEGGNTT